MQQYPSSEDYQQREARNKAIGTIFAHVTIILKEIWKAIRGVVYEVFKIQLP